MNSLNWLKGNYFGNLASVMLALGGIFCSPVTFSSAVIAYYYSIIAKNYAAYPIPEKAEKYSYRAYVCGIIAAVSFPVYCVVFVVFLIVAIVL
ncbi:hypothetical protein EMCRGX_G000172 [Ephydatia muelleri]|eukprot:Em0001g80a